jgi:hypothetical protein
VPIDDVIASALGNYPNAQEHIGNQNFFKIIKEMWHCGCFVEFLATSKHASHDKEKQCKAESTTEGTQAKSCLVYRWIMVENKSHKQVQTADLLSSAMI